MIIMVSVSYVSRFLDDPHKKVSGIPITELVSTYWAVGSGL